MRSPHRTKILAALLAALPALAACARTSALDAPTAPDSARSALLELEDAHGPALYALQRAAGAEPFDYPPFSAAAGDRLIVAFSSQPLDDLLLPAGPLPARSASADAALPLFELAYATDPAAQHWRALDDAELTPALSALALDDPLAACAHRPGCIRLNPIDREAPTFVCPADCAREKPNPPAPPAAPALPRLVSCPAGWTPHTFRSTLAACAPPDRLQSPCPQGQAQWIDATTCAPVGAACPSSGFAADLPTGTGIIYVASAAPPGGDGARLTPFAALADALHAATLPGTIIALTAGTYDLREAPAASTILWGACAERTILTGEPTASLALRDGTRFHGLTLRNAPLSIGPDAVHVELESVVADGTPPIAIAVLGAGTLTATASAFAGAPTVALSVSAGGRAELHRAVIAGAGATNLRVEDPGSRFSADDLVLANAAASNLIARHGPELRLARVLFDHSHLTALLATGPGTHLAVSDAVVRRTYDYPTNAVLIEDSAKLELSRALLEQDQAFALVVRTATAAIEDACFGNLFTPGDPQPYANDVGIWSDGGSIRVARAIFGKNGWTNIRLTGPGTADLSDLVIHDEFTAAAPGQFCARGIAAEEADLMGDAQLTGRRLELSGLHRGLELRRAAGANLEDLDIHDIILPAVECTGGSSSCLYRIGEGPLTLARAALGPCAQDSISGTLGSKSEWSLSDLDLRRTSFGIDVLSHADPRQGLGTLLIERAAIAEQRQGGIYVQGAIQATARELEISGVPNDPAFTALHGAVVAIDGALELEDFLIHDNEVAAIAVCSGLEQRAELSARRGSVHGNPVGISALGFAWRTDLHDVELSNATDIADQACE